MSITKRNFLLILTLFTLLVGGIGAGVLHSLNPGRYVDAYPLIPIYFYLYGIFYIYMFDACRRHAPRKRVMLFMALKGMKLILSVLLLLLYCVAVPDSAVVFLLTFLAFYLGYLVYESWFFFAHEWNKSVKNKSTQDETVA